MENNMSNEENEILKALESIHLETQNLEHCLKKTVTTKRLLEAKWNSVTSHLSSFLEESYNLQDANIINCEKIQAIEKETEKLEKSKKNLDDTIDKLKAEIRQHKGSSDDKVDNLVVDADKLCQCFLLTATNNETVEEECLLKLADCITKMKSDIIKKESNVSKLKKELEECDFYDFPEDPMELQVPVQDRQLIMNMMENNLKNTRQQLEDLYELKAFREKEESSM